MMNDRHLLVRYNVQYVADKDDNLSMVDEDVSIIDNNAFPDQHMSPINVPLSVKTLSCVRILGSSYGITCFHGYHKDYQNIDSEMVVFWNPSVRKSVSVLLEPRLRYGWVGFGACPNTRDPKLVTIDNVKGTLEVHVYTLSTRAWKKVDLNSPYMPYIHLVCDLRYHVGVCVEQFLYWLGIDEYVVSFDLSNDKFGKDRLDQDSLKDSECLMLSKWNEYLVVFEYCDIYGHLLNYSDVWMLKRNVIHGPSYTILLNKKLIFPKYDSVLELRKNGEAIIETRYANDDLQVFDICSNVSLISKFSSKFPVHENTLWLGTLVCYL